MTSDEMQKEAHKSLMEHRKAKQNATRCADCGDCKGQTFWTTSATFWIEAVDTWLTLAASTD